MESSEGMIWGSDMSQPQTLHCRYGTFERTLHYWVFAGAWKGEGEKVEDKSVVASFVEPGAPTVSNSAGS